MDGRRKQQHIIVLMVLSLTLGSGIIYSCDSFSFYDLMDSHMLVISPESISLNAGTQYTFSASGGTPPYTFSVRSGTSNIDPATGVLTAAASAETDIVRVTDGRGAWTEATVQVIFMLSITPSSANIEANGSLIFTASGGISPYSFRRASGGGSIIDITPSSVRFDAPDVAGTSVIEVSDSNGSSVTAQISVSAPGTLILNPPNAVLDVNESIVFTASGGIPPYALNNSGAGIVTPLSGTEWNYTAPSSTGSDTVTLTDSSMPTGQTAISQISISSAGPLQINPTNITITPDDSPVFTASGGTGSYTFSIQSGGGSITPTGPDSALFTPPQYKDKTTIALSDGITTITTSVKIKP